MCELTGGKGITVYGQNEVVKDLIGARIATARPLYFEAENVSVGALESAEPVIRFRHGGEDQEIRCDFIAGCDGFHGICRPFHSKGRLDRLRTRLPIWLAGNSG